MIHIEIIAVGSLKESWMREGCAEYIKRMGLWSKVRITEVGEHKLPKAPTPAQIAEGIQREGQRILEKLPKGAAVAALCIEGKQITSEGLAEYLEGWAGRGIGTAAFVIGGSHGMWEEVKERADIRLSMSRMTFPHQLARVMLCEQLYRGMSIIAGGKYHK